MPVAISGLKAVKIGSVKIFSPWLRRASHLTSKSFLRMVSDNLPQNGTTPASAGGPRKLQGRQFYESIGSPKYIVAPMVDRSEFVSNYSLHSFCAVANIVNIS